MKKGERAVIIAIALVVIDVVIVIIGMLFSPLLMAVALVALVVGLVQCYYFITYLKGAGEELSV